MRTSGVRAHSARAWIGENAIHKAAPILARLAEYRPREVSVEGLVYREGLNAVRIGGGIAGLVGKQHDKQLRKEQGIEKPNYGTVLPAKLDQGISQAVHDSRQASDLHSKGMLTPETMPASDATKVKLGLVEPDLFLREFGTQRVPCSSRLWRCVQVGAENL